MLAVVLGSGAVAQIVDTEPPLEGAAYLAANDAYKSFGQGDYSNAARRAAESVALRPDILRLRLLLINSLVAANDLSGAERAVATASETFASNPELEARLSGIRRRRAQQPADEGYKALERGDPTAAIRAAGRAVQMPLK